MGSKIPLAKRSARNVLDRFFAQVVIDAVDLALGSDFQKLLVQRLGGIEIVAKRLFDDDAPPMAVLLGHQADFCQALDDVAEVVGRGGEVEKIVAVGVVLLVDLGESLFQLFVGGGIVEISADVTDAADKPLPQIGIDGPVANCLKSSVSFLRASSSLMGLRPTPITANSRDSNCWLARL
jgi:hypothetical protein